MKTIRCIAAGALLAVSLAFAAGCGGGTGGGGGGPLPPGVDSSVTSPSGIKYTIEVEGSDFSRGQTVPVALIVSNNSTAAVTIPVPYPYDVWAYQGTTNVWDYNFVNGASPNQTAFTLQPGQSRGFYYDWNQKSGSASEPNQVQVPAGTYTL